jgi:hypothetical protein
MKEVREMINPGMFGVNPEQLKAAQEVGRHLKLEVRKCPREGRVEIRYVAIDPNDAQAAQVIGSCVEGMAAQLAHLHDIMFGMKGKIINQP